MSDIKCYKKNGISLVAIVATLIIAIILITTVVVTSRNILNDNSKKSFAKEIYLIDKKVDEYKFKNSVYPVIDEVSINVSSIDTRGKDQFENEPGYGSGTITLKELNLYEADIETVSRGTKKDGTYDVYAISETTNKIYYLKGYKAGGMIYYTLTDELLKLIGMSK
jgi:hypothetical protein